MIRKILLNKIVVLFNVRIDYRQKQLTLYRQSVIILLSENKSQPQSEDKGKRESMDLENLPIANGIVYSNGFMEPIEIMKQAPHSLSYQLAHRTPIQVLFLMPYRFLDFR